jgi:hypothetical protein
MSCLVIGSFRPFSLLTPPICADATKPSHLTPFSRKAAICTNGQTMAQIFVGRTSLVIDIFGMSTEKQFVNTLEDVIRGAMDKLITDSARRDLQTDCRHLRSLCIDA